MKEYKVGDGVWYATYENREVRVPCPVCNGNLFVSVILGKGEEVRVECDYCGKGFDGAVGYVVEYEKLPRADYRVITKRKIEDTGKGEDIEYQSEHYLLNIERIFDTENEAMEFALSMVDFQQDKPKYKNEKSYSWNAGYHMRAAERARKEAEYHEAKAKICKSKAKE